MFISIQKQLKKWFAEDGTDIIYTSAVRRSLAACPGDLPAGAILNAVCVFHHSGIFWKGKAGFC
jgi:hypothetical protein